MCGNDENRRNKHCVGDFIELETESREYKEFRLSKSFHEIREQEAKDIVENNNIELLMKIAHCVLTRYIQLYVPKYLVSFGNAMDIDTDGELHIGVSDFGEILGVPIASDEHKMMIHDLVFDCAAKTLENNSQDVREHIMSQIRVEFLPLDVSEESITSDAEIRSIVEKYKRSYHYQIEQHQHFAQEHSLWLKEIQHYKLAFNIFANIRYHREKLIKMIRRSNINDEELKAKLVEQLKSPAELIFEDGEIPRRKYDVTDITFWLVNYRESFATEILKRKPRRPLIRIQKPYKTMVRESPAFVQRILFRESNSSFVKNNIGMFIVKITFPCKSPEVLFFHDGFRYKSNFRTTDKNNKPMCASP